MASLSVSGANDGFGRQGGAGMGTDAAMHVLSVGPVERGCTVRDALRNRAQAHLSITPDYKRLWTFPQQEQFHVVILHNTLSGAELEETTRFIRRRWPQARILVIRYGEEFLEDALYDERVTPTATEATLQAVLDRLVDGGHA